MYNIYGIIGKMSSTFYQFDTFKKSYIQGKKYEITQTTRSNSSITLQGSLKLLY